MAGRCTLCIIACLHLSLSQQFSTPSAPEIIKRQRDVETVVGDSVHLSCLSRGDPAPRYEWQFQQDKHTGFRTLQSRGDNHRVLETGQLNMTSVSRLHQGVYRCRVWNSLGSTTASAHLAVRVAVQVLGTETTSEAVRSGSLVTLTCDLGGDPLPEVIWTYRGEPLPDYSWKSSVVVDGSVYPPFDRFVRSLLSVRPAVSSEYICQGSNRVVQLPRLAASSLSVSVVGAPPLDADGSPLGYCAPYVGEACRRQVSVARYVFYNGSQQGGDNDQVLISQLTRHADLLKNTPCLHAIQVLLCHVGFPQCRLQDGRQMALPPCRQDCLAVRELFCSKQWSLINQQQVSQQLYLPDCEVLPEYGDGTEHTCSHGGLTTIQASQTTYECVREDGRYYQGRMNVTAAGVACQPWQLQRPHEHTTPLALFPEMREAENFCRNVGGMEPRPWCYTVDSTVRWQYCDIPVCADGVTLYADDPSVASSDVDAGSRSAAGSGWWSLPGGGTLDPLFILVAAIAGVAALILLGMLSYGCYQCQGSDANRRKRLKETETIDLAKLPANSSYHQHEPLLPASLERLEYPRNDIIYIRDLGQGAFGRVFQGKAPGLVEGEDFTLVAVKMLKDEASEDMEKDFEREALLLAGFEHENIVQLLGVCAVGKPLCLLFEYMSEGDLTEYLRQGAPKNVIVKHETGEIFSDSQLSHWDMSVIARQIAAGMLYLSERQFVHRDLACRNCLIDQLLQVKIADFGLSQKIGSDYFRGDEHDAVPVRWMPLESVLYNKYTLQSDVWAFGVVLWEIFSFALQPYFGMAHEEVVRYLKEGRRLKRPENTPRTVYELMSHCWLADPDKRPNFAIIIDRLIDFQGRLERQMDIYGHTNAYSTYASRAASRAPSIGSPSSSRHE